MDPEALRQEYSPASGYRPGSPRERLISSILSATIIALVVLLMLYQFVVSPTMKVERRPVTFSVSDENVDKAARRAQARPKAPHVATRAVERPNTPINPVITVQKRTDQPDTLEGIPGFISMSKAQLASSDIGRTKGPAKGSDSNGQGQDARTAYGPGEGPGGMMLYDADWYRKPSDAQLATYMPQNGMLAGWGLVACQTIDHYHVDNCRILGESPRGSGFGRAVQNAAWQFLVTPPRINNRPQIGAWVKIRIDYHVVGRGSGSGQGDPGDQNDQDS